MNTQEARPGLRSDHQVFCSHHVSSRLALLLYRALKTSSDSYKTTRHLLLTLTRKLQRSGMTTVAAFWQADVSPQLKLMVHLYPRFCAAFWAILKKSLGVTHTPEGPYTMLKTDRPSIPHIAIVFNSNEEYKYHGTHNQFVAFFITLRAYDARAHSGCAGADLHRSRTVESSCSV